MGLLPPVGRSGAGGRNSQQGLMARATATSDPEYSAIQQWTWLRAGQPRGWPLAAWGEVALDPTLPAKRPDWEFDVFGRTGVIMRHGLGTPAEWYIYCMCEQDFAYHTESLGFPIIFARGAPVSARFSGGYAEREELFISRVLPARPRGDNEYRWSHFEHLGPRKIAATSGLPRQQYVRMEQTLQRTRRQYHEGSAFNKMRPLPEWPAVAKKAKLPIEMIRQVLFLRDADPAGANYLVVRDTVPTDQPTMWQFWTISEKIGTPEQAAQREAFLADAPKMQPGETRKLPHGPRYTAVGQFGVDLEFFVALPTDTPRHALHWSREYHYSPINQFKEYMDMLHLQRAGAGDYFVAIFPRKPDEPMPRFQRLGDHAIQVSGPWGTDTVFLSAETVQATAGAASFEGTAGSAQDRSGELILCLGAGGKVGYKQYRLSCEHPVALHAAPGRLLLELPANPEGTTVRLTGPGALALEEVKPGLSLRRADGGYAVDVSPGMTRVRMTKQ
jgi:hypothetical protein